jgi:hypothetical protein
MLLQLFHRLGDGRLGEADRLGGKIDAVVPAHGLKGAQVAQIRDHQHFPTLFSQAHFAISYNPYHAFD